MPDFYQLKTSRIIHPEIVEEKVVIKVKTKYKQYISGNISDSSSSGIISQRIICRIFRRFSGKQKTRSF